MDQVRTPVTFVPATDLLDCTRRYRARAHDERRSARFSCGDSALVRNTTAGVLDEIAAELEGLVQKGRGSG